MRRTNGPKMKKFDSSKIKFDYTKTSYMFGFRPLNIRSAAQEKMDPQPLESDALFKPAPFYPPGISREGRLARKKSRKRKQGERESSDDDEGASDDSDDSPLNYSSASGRRAIRRSRASGSEIPSTSFKLKMPTATTKKVKSDPDFFESLLDSCQKWLSPPNAIKKGIRDLDRKDTVWNEGEKHKVVIVAAGNVAKKMAVKAEEIVKARPNTTVLQTLVLGPREYEIDGSIKPEILNKVAAIIKKHDACKPKFLFLVTRSSENALYGMRTGVTAEMAEEVHTTIAAEDNSEMTDIIDWKVKDIKKGEVSQFIKKGTIHGIVCCGAPKKIVRPGQAPDPAALANEYPQFRDVSRRLSDILDTFPEPVQDGLAAEGDFIVHLKHVITAPQEMLRTIAEKFKDLECDRRIISRTPPLDAEAMGLMIADLICCREFSQCPLLDPIELGEYQFPLVLVFFDGNHTDDNDHEEDRHLKTVMHCLDKLKRKQFLRGFGLLSAKFVNSKSEGVFITNEDLESEIATREYQPGLWEEFNDGDNLIGYTGLEGCEYNIHVLSLFR